MKAQTEQLRLQTEQVRLQAESVRADSDRSDKTLRAQTEQLRLQTDQVKSEAASARANLLLRIDEHYEGAVLRPSRDYWLELRTHFRHELGDLAATKAARDDHVHAEMVKYPNNLSDKLQQGDEASRDKYYLITNLPNWWETIGMLAKENMVPLTDIEKLYRGVILETMSAICEHREHRRRTNPNSMSFENAIWLYEAVRTP